jgi:hypothetical protein
MRGYEARWHTSGAEARTQALLQERLSEIGDRLEQLRPIRDSGGDVLAGRIIETLEREKAKIRATVAARKAGRASR